MKGFKSIGLVGLLFLATASFAQVPAIKNPTALSFTSPDHANVGVTGYEVDILNNSVVVQTINIAKSATTVLPSGDIKVTLNVQPIAFGNTYRFVVRTIAGATKSDNSLQSDIWERVPGSPSKPLVQ